MPRPSHHFALAWALLAGVALAPLHAQQVLEAGREYRAGTRVRSPWTGVTFAVPEGMVGMYDAEVRAFQMAPTQQGQYLVGVFAFSEGEIEEVAEVIHGRLSELGVSIQPRGDVAQTPDRLAGSFDAMTPEGPGVLYGIIERGDPGNVIAVLALGAPRQESRLRPLAGAVVGSATFGTPGAAQWRREAAGNAYVRGASGSDYSPGVSSGSGASGTRDQIDLCSDGTYAYEYHSESYVSIEGASASSESQDRHVGGWWLVADIAGGATLVLEATDGRVFHWSVAETPSGVEIDGATYAVQPSGRCR